MARILNGSIHQHNDYIEQINVGGKIYDIHDPEAIHDIEDLNLGNVFQFKGTVDKVKAETGDASTVTSLDRLTNVNVGDVYHVNANAIEYVYVKDSSGTGSWEPLGGITNALSQDSFNNFVSAVFNVHGHECSGEVTASGSVANTVGTITKKKLGVALAAPTVTPTTDKVIGADTTIAVSGGKATTQVVSATASGTELEVTTDKAITAINLTRNPFVNNVTTSGGEFVVGLDTTNTKKDTFVKGYSAPSTKTVVTGLGTPSTKTFLTGLGSASTSKAITALGTPVATAVITGFGDHSTTAFIKAGGLNSANLTAVKSNTNVTIPNVTGASSVSASKLKSTGGTSGGSAGTACTMSVSGHVLTLAPNTPTVTPTITMPTFDTVIATNVTLGTALVASKIETETKSYVNGIKSDGTATEEAITALGTPTTANAITGFGTHTTQSFVTGYSAPTSDSAITSITPTTASVISGLGTPTTASAITEPAYIRDTAIVSVTPTTANAVTGEGTPTTADFVTGVTVKTEPTIAIKVGSNTGSNAKVVTAVSAITAALNTNDQVDALTAVSVAAPAGTVTLIEDGGPEVVTAVGTKNTTVNVSGTHSCTTGHPVNPS